MSKVFIGIITQDQKQNIEELTSVYRWFDGLAAVDHFSTDGTYDILMERAKSGFVERIPYWGSHSHSMNHFLLNPKIELGDWILLRDSSERVAESFAKDIRNFIAVMEAQNIATIYQYSKLLLFRRAPHQFFHSTPHWGFQGARQNTIQIEKMNWFKTDEDYCYSVRNKNRDSRHFVGAYLRYYLLTDSNHPMLAIDKAEAEGITYADREMRRILFLQYLRNKNIPATVDGVKELMSQAMDDECKNFFRKEKILNDTFREFQLKDSSFPDNHDHKNLVAIP